MLWRMSEMVAPRALVFRPLVKGNEALGTRLQSNLNNHICQHRGVKTSTMTSSFYYNFNISLSYNNCIPSFMENQWRVLLLGNHLKKRCEQGASLIPGIGFITIITPTSFPGSYLFLPRESTLAAAGHVPNYTNQIRTEGGFLT